MFLEAHRKGSDTRHFGFFLWSISVSHALFVCETEMKKHHWLSYILDVTLCFLSSTLSPSQITKVPLIGPGCGQLTTCTSCLLSSRVTECGWCDGRCTRANQCPSSSQWTQDYCTPVITKVSTATSHRGDDQGRKLTFFTHSSLSTLTILPVDYIFGMQNMMARWESLNSFSFLRFKTYQFFIVQLTSVSPLCK